MTLYQNVSDRFRQNVTAMTDSKLQNQDLWAFYCIYFAFILYFYRSDVIENAITYVKDVREQEV